MNTDEEETLNAKTPRSPSEEPPRKTEGAKLMLSPLSYLGALGVLAFIPSSSLFIGVHRCPIGG